MAREDRENDDKNGAADLGLTDAGLPLPLKRVAGGVRLAVRLTPKAARDRIDGIVADSDGVTALKVGVTAVPEDGKANAALIRLLAKSWKLAKTDISLISGATDRRKLLLLAGDEDLALDLAAKLRGL